MLHALGDKAGGTAVGDVLHQTVREADERRIVVNGSVETAVLQEVGSCENEVADAAIAKAEHSSHPQLSGEALQPCGNIHPGVGGQGTERGIMGPSRQVADQAQHRVRSRFVG